MNSFLLGKILTIPAILVAFTAQGYARAKVADRLGDKTPRFQGRLTLDPLAHIDPLGFLMILFVGFGWTKPIDTNPNAYKRGYKDAIKVTVAAPLANLIVGFVFTFIYALWSNLFYMLPSNIYQIGGLMILFIAQININLFVFNLLPLPGLAGFEIWKELSPKTFYKHADAIYQYQMFILLGVLFLASSIIAIPANLIFSLFKMVAFGVLGIFF